MKTFKLTLIAIMVSVSASFSFAGASKIQDNNPQASIIKSEKQSMLVHVNKELNALVKVEIKDAIGNIIYSKVVKNQKFSGKFDFSNVADGSYTILVSDKSGVIASKEISIFTSREIAMR